MEMLELVSDVLACPVRQMEGFDDLSLSRIVLDEKHERWRTFQCFVRG